MGEGEKWSIGMMGWRQVTPRWTDDTVRKQYISECRGCWVRRGLPPPEGHWTAGGEDGAGQD